MKILRIIAFIYLAFSTSNVFSQEAIHQENFQCPKENCTLVCEQPSLEKTVYEGFLNVHIVVMVSGTTRYTINYKDNRNTSIVVQGNARCTISDYTIPFK